MVSKVFKNLLEVGQDNLPHLQFLWEKLNMKLLGDITAFQEYTSKQSITKGDWANTCIKGDNFCREHNLSYMGELLERFDERGIASDKKDLFTLVFTVSGIMSLTRIAENTNQVTVFENKILERLEKDYDQHTALALLQCLHITAEEQNSFTTSRYNRLLQKIFSNIESTSSLEELSYVISCLSDEQRTFSQSQENITTLRAVFEPVLISTLESITNIETRIIPMRYVIQVDRLLGYPKANEVKTKFFAAFLQSLFNLQLKEISDAEVEKIQRFLPVSEEQIHLLNYVSVKFIEGEKKISGPGYERIATKMAQMYLKKDVTLPESAVEAIVLEETRCRGFLMKLVSSVDMSKCKENFKTLANRVTTLDRWEPHSFYYSNSRYILDDSNLYNLLPDVCFKELIMNFIRRSTSKDDFTTLLELADSKGLMLSNDTVFSKKVEFGLYDIYNFTTVNGEDSITLDYLNTLLKKQNLAYQAQYYLKLIEAVGAYSLNEKLWSFFSSCYKSYEKIANNELERKVVQVYSNIFFVKEPQNYAEFLYSNLINESYLELVGISSEDKDTVLKSLLASNLLKREDSENIRKMYLTEEENIKEEVSKKIKSIQDAYSITKVASEISDELIKEPEVKDIVLAKIKKEGHLFGKYLECAMKLLKKLVVNSVITEKELFDCVTSIKV